MGDEAVYFATPDELRDWLERNHAQVEELWVGYFKRGTGEASVTWSESVDEALCFGWIDGVRKSIDERRYRIRFTPRRPGSRWSRRNVERMAALAAEGRLREAGQRAFAARTEEGTYSYEEREGVELAPELERAFRRAAKAWSWYSSQAPWYQRTTKHWVMSAKREETRRRRFATLLECSAAGRYIPQVPARK